MYLSLLLLSNSNYFIVANKHDIFLSYKTECLSTAVHSDLGDFGLNFCLECDSMKLVV